MQRLERIKVGDEVKFTQDYLDFWYNEAFNMCSRAGGITSDADAKDYLIRKILSLGYPYKAVVVSRRLPDVGKDETGEGIPGYRVKLILPHGMIDETVVGVNNFALYKRKKK